MDCDTREQNGDLMVWLKEITFSWDGEVLRLFHDKIIQVKLCRLCKTWKTRGSNGVIAEICHFFQGMSCLRILRIFAQKWGEGRKVYKTSKTNLWSFLVLIQVFIIHMNYIVIIHFNCIKYAYISMLSTANKWPVFWCHCYSILSSNYFVHEFTTSFGRCLFLYNERTYAELQY